MRKKWKFERPNGGLPLSPIRKYQRFGDLPPLLYLDVICKLLVDSLTSIY